MANTTLSAQKREGTGKGVARKLRQIGRVPAVLYGRDLESMHLSVDAHEARLLFHSISVENTIVELSVEGEKGSYQTLVREIQSHPSRGSLTHIDFLRIQKGVMVDVEVPLHLVGSPIGVKNHGGVIEQMMHELPVRCIPSKIPESLDVDISHLDINESLYVSDITFDEGVEVTVDLDRTICTITLPRAEVAADDDDDDDDDDADGADAAEDADGDEG